MSGLDIITAQLCNEDIKSLETKNKNGLHTYFQIKGPNWNTNKRVCLKTQEKVGKCPTDQSWNQKWYRDMGKITE